MKKVFGLISLVKLKIKNKIEIYNINIIIFNIFIIIKEQI